MNTSQTLLHLKQELEKEDRELRELKEKVRLAEEDAQRRGQEIPKLTQQIVDDRHMIYADKTEEDKLKKRIAELQREQVVNRNHLTQISNAHSDNVREHSRLTR